MPMGFEEAELRPKNHYLISSVLPFKKFSFEISAGTRQMPAKHSRPCKTLKILPPPPTPSQLLVPELPPGITGVVLTRNAERLAHQCFSSLSFCTAILAVDSGSTDATEAIAKNYGATFIFRPWQGFASQFTYAHTIVQTRWFFILDQDEICPPGLATQIIQAVSKADALCGKTPPQLNAPVAFAVGRTSWYFDRFMKHGGWHPDYVPRVFRTGYVQFSQKAHIEYHPQGPQERIQGGQDHEIIHYPYTSFFHQLEKLNTYAEQGACSMRQAGKRGGIAAALGHGAARFLRIYFLKKGFLDGKAGFLAAAHGAIYAFLKYIRTLDASWGAPFTPPSTMPHAGADAATTHPSSSANTAHSDSATSTPHSESGASTL